MQTVSQISKSQVNPPFTCTDFAQNPNRLYLSIQIRIFIVFAQIQANPSFQPREEYAQFFPPSRVFVQTVANCSFQTQRRNARSCCTHPNKLLTFNPKEDTHRYTVFAQIQTKSSLFNPRLNMHSFCADSNKSSLSTYRPI